MTGEIDCVIIASLKVITRAKSRNNLKRRDAPRETRAIISKKQGYKGRKLMGTIMGEWEIKVFICGQRNKVI